MMIFKLYMAKEFKDQAEELLISILIAEIISIAKKKYQN